MSIKSDNPMHYHLVSGMVLFTRQNSDVVEEIYLNTTVQTKNKTVPAKAIGQAQQGIQMLLFKREGAEVTVTDVFIMSVSYLGHMTQEAFVEGVDELQAQAA